MSGPVSPLALERYELKYLIPLSLVGPISQYVERYCEMDYYSRISPDLFYTINSLYLDTPSLYIMRFKETANAFNFNMRIRSYGDSPRPPYFFEIKYKLRDFVRKKRAKIDTMDWVDIVEWGNIPSDMEPGSLGNLEDFLFMKQTYNVGPVILTQYRRKAYLSVVDDYARVTFDRDLRFQEMDYWCVNPQEENLSHYDHPASFEEPGCNVILELKCEKKIPLWMVDLIRYFQLEQGSFSKFGNSMLTHLQMPEVLRPGILY
ncbi:polyphosphate polymerase domain-containing protein [Bdellovibrio bacteriovorus]|uniref:polyphosphate polymerase domain-containing protein n=1 Tax=Bdellovibrio bacteriovorus TaxID=959 RepID=UPI0021CEB0D7|nr:polyphosphate polymerase domain-containing protein [Bdellovibrio bacteriovorus]UXR64678.1 polyphosphate polymerase domain-containing protein [Bdellovibrio bacteriovorus]